MVAKIIKIISIIVISVLILLFSLSLIMQNKVAGLLLKSLNNNFSTKIESGSYRLSLIKKFPKASVELKNVLVHSSPEFDRTGFKGINTDTLLAAKSASIDFRTFDLLRGNYTFTKISIRSGTLHLYTDTFDHSNYDISKNNSINSSTENVTLNFNKINLADVGFIYNDLRANLVIKGKFKDGQFKSKFKGDRIDFEGKSKSLINLFHLGNIYIRQTIPADLEIELNKNEKGIFFKRSTLGIEKWIFVLTGFISADNYLDINVSAENLDISNIINLLPEKYKTSARDYNPTGNLKFEWRIKGKSTRTEDPHYDVTYSLNNARIDNKKSDLRIGKLSFDGYYSNGIKNSSETSQFSIRNFTASLGSADYRGSFSIFDFSNPKVELIFRGKLLPAEISEFMNLKNISNASGSIDLNLKFSGNPGKKDPFNFTDVFKLNSQSEVVFNSVSITFENKQLDIRDVTGRFLIEKSTVTDDFRFTLNNQKMILSGIFMNFPGWLTGNPVNLSGSAEIAVSSLRPELFMKTSTETNTRKKNGSTNAPFTFPDDVNVEMDFDIDTLLYKTFNARNITGTLSIMPKMMNFRAINLNSQKGRISGNGLVVQNRDKSFVGRGSFSLTGVDVNEAFTTFHNFGQNFLKAENIAGTLSGSITLILPVDSLLNPDTRSVIAEGKYSITDGALIDFDPAKALSSFIELSELKNIKFDKLENDFFVRNSIFYVPQMDIKSTAVNLSVNGTHSFDNDYQYHVKMLLSEILSNKSKKTRISSDEFGEVEDDGLGRTSVFLKIAGKGEDVKVSYDIAAAGDEIKVNVKREKQVLKTIIEEEYGLYKKDSGAEKHQGSQPRFRISWDESDTTSSEPEPPEQRKKSFLDRLFKKK